MTHLCRWHVRSGRSQACKAFHTDTNPRTAAVFATSDLLQACGHSVSGHGTMLQEMLTEDTCVLAETGVSCGVCACLAGKRVSTERAMVWSLHAVCSHWWCLHSSHSCVSTTTLLSHGAHVPTLYLPPLCYALYVMCLCVHVLQTQDSWFNTLKLKLPTGAGYEIQMRYGRWVTAGACICLEPGVPDTTGLQTLDRAVIACRALLSRVCAHTTLCLTQYCCWFLCPD